MTTDNCASVLFLLTKCYGIHSNNSEGSDNTQHIMSSMNQKMNEAGWFYHAPAKRREHQEAVGVPPTSQIPGLGETEILEPEEPKEMVFRDTDTKYIRMAKMGGRKDLLSIKPNSRRKEPVNYPRNDWFYLEDNELEDKAKREQEEQEWQFMLPEYMVHQAHGGQADDMGTVSMPRAPYATETQSQFTCDGHLMTDKTVKLPETRRPGYGVRSAKPAPKGPKMDKNKPLSSQVQGEWARLKQQPLPSEPEEPTSMNKLLSNTYEREWHVKVNKWQEKHAQDQSKSQAYSQKDRPMQSEYNNNYRSSAASSQNQPRRTHSGQTKEPPKKTEVEKKELFKMSKFKNVHARINSHQSPEVLAAVGN